METNSTRHPPARHYVACLVMMIYSLRLFVFVFQVKIWFQNRRSKYKKMLKAQQPGSNNAQSGQSGQSGAGGSTPIQTPTSASTPQTPPETPESQTPPNVPPPVVPPNVSSSIPNLMSGTSIPSSGIPTMTLPTMTSTVSPQTMSPPISSWDMGSAKAAAMSNSYIPQYSWYHHGHDPNFNPQLLTWDVCESINKQQVKYSTVISSLSACHSCHGLNHHSKLYKDSSRPLPTKRSLKISTTKPKRPSFQHHINCEMRVYIVYFCSIHFSLSLHHHRHHRCSCSISDTFIISLHSFLLWDALYSSHSIVALYHVKHTEHHEHHTHKQHWECRKMREKERSLCCVEPEKNVSSSRYSCINSGSSLAKQVEVNHEKSPLLSSRFFVFFFLSLLVLEKIPLLFYQLRAQAVMRDVRAGVKEKDRDAHITWNTFSLSPVHSAHPNHLFTLVSLLLEGQARKETSRRVGYILSLFIINNAHLTLSPASRSACKSWTDLLICSLWVQLAALFHSLSFLFFSRLNVVVMMTVTL